MSKLHHFFVPEDCPLDLQPLAYLCCLSVLVQVPPLTRRSALNHISGEFFNDPSICQSFHIFTSHYPFFCEWPGFVPSFSIHLLICYINILILKPPCLPTVRLVTQTEPGTGVTQKSQPQPPQQERLENYIWLPEAANVPCRSTLVYTNSRGRRVQNSLEYLLNVTVSDTFWSICYFVDRY